MKASGGALAHCNETGSLRIPLADCLKAAMRQVIAIVKPFLAEKILEGLRFAPLEAVHVREVKGMGRQKSYLDQYTESEYSEAFLPKVEITAWVEDSRSEEVIRKMVELARTGRMGDGKILVLAADTPETLAL
jgi:nitrogen regulatory protein P-II 1